MYLNQRTRIPNFLLGALVIFVSACATKNEQTVPRVSDFNQRKAVIATLDSLPSSKTYLSVYSQIYSYSEKTTFDLTATVSLRNTSEKDSIYVFSARYYDTKGNSLNNYITEPIYVKPLETIHIIIEETDKQGGAGANFIFDWKAKPTAPSPLFEAVMISTSGSQGISFTTTGKLIQ